MRLKTITQKIIDFGVEGQPISFRKTIIRTINVMALINIGVGLVANFVIYVATDIRGVLIPSLGEDLLFVVVLCLNKRRAYDPAAFLMYVTHCLSVLYFGAKFGENSHAGILTLYLLVAAYLVFKTNAYRIVAMVMSVITIVLLELNYQHKYIPEWQITTSQVNLVRWTIYASVTTLGVTLMFFFIQRSVQQARLTEMEIASKTEKYLKAEKATSMLLNEVTHEISNPAHIITQTVSNYIQRVDNIEGITRMDILLDDLWRLTTAGSVIADQCSTILTWARYEKEGERAINNETMDVHSWATDLIRLYEHKALQKNVTLILNINENTPQYIITDRIKVNHIVTNLIVNAIKFSFEKTDIYVNVRHSDSRLIISVKDNGPGIPEDKQNKIFEAFFTSGESSVGIMSTGVGLALAKKLVQQLNGTITLHSKEGKGAKFTVSIPLTIPTDEEIKSFINFSNFRFNGQKILVIEDSDFLRDITMRSVARFGCLPVGAASPEEAVIAAVKELPDVILLDFNLKNNFNTLDLINEFKSNSILNKTPIIVISSAEFEQIQRCFEAGVDAFLPKPFKDSQLKQKLATFIPLVQVDS